MDDPIYTNTESTQPSDTEIFIANFLKEAYGENFYQLRGPVGLLVPYFSCRFAVETATYNLGNNLDEITASLEILKEKYPADTHYCSFWRVNHYKSEEFSKAFIEKFYPNGSRFPIENISKEEFDKTDAFSIRCAFTSYEEYERRGSRVGRYGSVESESIKFYSYNCDKLYTKYLEDEEARLKSCDQYAIALPDPGPYLVRKTGFVRGTLDQIRKTMASIELKHGKNFVEWLSDERVYLVINNHKGTKYAVPYVDKGEGVSQFSYRYTISPENEEILSTRLFKTEKEFKDFYKSILIWEKVAFLPKEFLHSAYDGNVEIIDYWDYQFMIKPKQGDPDHNVSDAAKAVYARLRDIAKDQQPNPVSDLKLLNEFNNL